MSRNTSPANRAMLVTSLFLVLSLTSLATPSQAMEMEASCQGLPIVPTFWLPDPDDGEWIVDGQIGVVYRPHPDTTVGVVAYGTNDDTRLAVGFTTTATECAQIVAQCVKDKITDDPPSFRPGGGLQVDLDALFPCVKTTFADL